MTTARAIIRGALTFHLNRLSPGEAEDADLFGRCLEALNAVVDEFNGLKSRLFREVFTVGSALTGTSGTLGTTWAGLSSGDQILGATVQDGGMDVPLEPMTMGSYADVSIKALATIPGYYAHDGAATVYIYPAAQGQTITLRTRQVLTDFADLATDYVMPKGYLSALQALVAEKMAPTLAPEMFGAASRAAQGARRRLSAQTINPAIVSSGDDAGPVTRIRRGY